MQTNNSEEIIGRWEAMQTTRGGLGSMLEFSRDGSLNVSFGPLLHGTYKLESGRLIEKTFQPDGSQTTEIREVVIQGDTLIIEADDVAKGYKISLVRLTPRDLDSSPIVGKWGQKAPNQFYEFKADGSSVISGGKWEVDFTKRQSFLESTILEYTKSGEFTFRISLSSCRGSYSISGDLLTTTLETGDKISKFRFENGYLYLQAPPNDGPEDKFKRSGHMGGDRSR